MPYDALGNYVPGDEPSIDQMQYELTKRGRPLDEVVNMFNEVISNPLGTAIKKGFEAREAVKDVGRIGVSFSPAAIVPVWQAVGEAGLSNVNKLGAEALYKLSGDEENAARVANERAQLPDVNKLIEKYSEPLQARTPGGQAIQQGVTKFLFDDLKLPPVPIGPRGSGFAASGERRPMLTPDDTRALLGEANRVGTQVRDIPTDFVNAQSGFTRLDPITNKPTFGAKLQGTAESLAETMERRKMQGLTPIPGLPAELQPETRSYAIRPDKSQAIVPKVPPTVSPDLRVDPFDQQRRAAVNVLDSLDIGDRQQTTRQYVNRYLATADREVKQALKDFNDAELGQMFPNMRIEDARAAAEALYSDPVAKEQRQQDLLNRFAQSHPQYKLPTFNEYQQRVAAVQTMMQDQYVPWVSKHLGTPSDPQLLLAQEGKTVIEPESLFESEAENPLTGVAESRRIAEGFPAKGTSYEKGLELQAQLDQARQVANASQQVYAEQQAAAGPGQSAHLMFPDFNENRAKKEKDEAVVRNLEQKIENNKLGQAYEDLADQAITPYTASGAQAKITKQNEQFYPKLMKQRADQKVYQIGAGPLDTMALGKRVAEDIMSGKIPLDLVPKLTDFTPLARKYSQQQAVAYAGRKEAERNYVGNANARFLDIVSRVPNDRVFGKLGAIFLDDSLSLNNIDELASQDTAILDHCIGEAGQSKSKSKLTGKTHGWVPMYDPASGVKNPKATRTHTRYGERIADGRYVVASLRDTETGYPITTISWLPRDRGPWATEYLSGFNNSEAIKPEYRDSVKAFLNSVNEGKGSEQLRGFRLDSPNDLENRYGLYDKDTKTSLTFARSSLSTTDKQALKDDPDILTLLPRFFSVEDLKQAIASPASSANAREPDNIRGLTQARNVLEEELASLTELGLHQEEMQTMIYDIQHEIADIDARLARAQQQQQQLAPQQAPTNITRDVVFRTLADIQLAIDPEAVVLQNLVFQATVNFDPNNLVQSLRDARRYLTQQVTDATNDRQTPPRTLNALNAVVSNGMIPRLNELIAELSPAQQPATENPMLAIRSDQAANMSYADLAAAVGDTTRFDDITGRAIREIRLNEREPSEVVQEIIDGRQIGPHNLMNLTPVERELIARDVTDTIRALSAATAAPRNTLRQDMVSAYVTALQHPDPQVSASLYAIRNMMDSITIDAQGRGETPTVIGGELINDISERIRNIEGLVDRRETVGGLTMQQTDQFLQGLIQAREQVAQAMISHAAQQPAQPQPQAQTPDIGDFIQTLRRDVSMQVAERVETVAFRVAENINPRANPLEYAQSLRQAANTEDSMQVEVSLNELADEFEAAHVRTQLEDLEPEDAVPNTPPPVDAVDLARGPSEYVQSIQPTINNLANELMYADMSPDGTPNVPAIESTIFALRNGTIDHAAFRAMPTTERQNAMNAVADDIDNRLIRNTPPVVDDNVYIDDDQAGLIIDDEMRNVFRIYGEAIGERVSRVIEDMLVHMSFADDPHGVIQHLRRNRTVSRNLPADVAGFAEQALQDIAQRLEDEFNTEFNARTQPQQQIAQSRNIPPSIRGMRTNEMTAQLPATSAHNVISLAAQITAVNSPDEIRNIVGLVRQYAIGGWENFIPMQREYLARYLERHLEENEPQQVVAQPTQPAQPAQPAQTAQQLIITDQDANEAQDAVDFFNDALEEIVDDNGRPAAIREIDRALEELNDGEDEIYGLWQGEELTPGIREALRNRLLYLRQEYLDEPPQEYAKGGRVQQIPSTDQMQYELIMRRA